MQIHGIGSLFWMIFFSLSFSVSLKVSNPPSDDMLPLDLEAASHAAFLHPSQTVRLRNPRTTTPTKRTINIASAKLGVERILPFS